MPNIGITIGKALVDGRWRYQCAEDYVRAILAAGGRPVLLPAETVLAAGESLAAEYAGFILSGGGDLEAGLYGQAPHPANGEPDPARDQAELFLASLAVRVGRPLLAICRGLQVLNVALGGDLLQDLPSAGFPGHDQAEPRTARTHPVELIGGTLLGELLPARIVVNSFHHQAVGRLAGDLAVAGRSPDGVIEAAVLPGRPVLGVQWHPEGYAHLAQDAARLFTWLVGESGRIGK